MCVLIQSTVFVCNISCSKKKWVRYDQKCVLVFMQSTRYSCPILIFEFSRNIFEKSSNIKFHENQYSGSQVVPCGRTDGCDEANNRFSQFANAPKNCTDSFTESLRAFCGLGWRKFCFRREVCTANKRRLTCSSVSHSDHPLVGEQQEGSDKNALDALEDAESTAERKRLFF